MRHKKMLLFFVGSGALAQVSNSLCCPLDEAVKEEKRMKFAIKSKDTVTAFNSVA
jgi:hypothetical protein